LRMNPSWSITKTFSLGALTALGAFSLLSHMPEGAQQIELVLSLSLSVSMKRRGAAALVLCTDLVFYPSLWSQTQMLDAHKVGSLPWITPIICGSAHYKRLLSLETIHEDFPTNPTRTNIEWLYSLLIQEYTRIAIINKIFHNSSSNIKELRFCVKKPKKKEHDPFFLIMEYSLCSKS
jgi:hypothetical protein